MKYVAVLFVVVFGLGFLAVGCASGPTAGVLPGDGAVRYTGAARYAGAHKGRGHRYRARLRLKIPPKRQLGYPHHRGPRYISPATRSLTIEVVPAGGTPLPLQTLVVATPSPCSTIAPSGGEQCAFSVEVMPGSDSFTIAAYAQPSPTGSPLSEYVTPTAIAMPSPGGSLAFTLEGVVDHVIMQYPSSVNTMDDASQVAHVPVGVATSAPIDIVPYDAQNYAILAQEVGGTPVPYAEPFTLAVSPASAGMTLSNDRGSGSSITIENPDDLSVLLDYDGSASASNGIVSSPSFVIEAKGSTFAPQALSRRSRARARRGPHGASLTVEDFAYAELASNVITYPVATPLATGTPNPIPFEYVPSAQEFAFGRNDNQGTGTFGTFLESNPSAVTMATVSSPPQSIYVDSYSGIWIVSTAGTVDCYSSVTSNPTQTISLTTYIPSALGFTGPSLVEDAKDNLWFDGAGDVSGSWQQGIGEVPLTGTCQYETPTVAVTPLPGNSAPSGAQGIATGGAWFGDTLASDAYKAVPGTAPSTPPTPTVSPIPIASPVYGLGGGSGTIYAVTMGSSGGAAQLGTVTSAGFVQATSAPLFFVPESNTVAISSSGEAIGPISPLGPSSSSADETLGMFGELGGALQLPMPAAPDYLSTCAAAFDSDQIPWAICDSPAQGLNAEKILLTSTWSVLPGNDITIVGQPNCALPYDLGIAQAPGVDTGPFTVVSSNAAVITPGTSPTGLDRLLPLKVTPPLTGGSTAVTLTVNDANGDSQSANVTVKADSSAQDCFSMRRRPAGRRGAIPRRR